MTCDRCQHYSAFLADYGDCDVDYAPATGYYAVVAVKASHTCDRWTARVPVGEIPAGPPDAPFLVTEIAE